MRYGFLLALTLLLFTSIFQTPAEPEKQLYRPTGNEARLYGTIVVKGTLPKPKIVDMSADPVCQMLNSKPEVQSLMTNGDKLLNAFVYVRSDLLKAYRFELPDSEVVLDRVNCQFSPRVFGMRVGQRFALVNSDSTIHNTHPVPKLNVEWNVSQMPQSAPLVKTFTRQEVLIPFKCNQHPWEKAYLSVMNHPFFDVSNELGNYEVAGLPAGTYKLVVWHELLGEQEMEITLVAGESRSVDFTFDADKDLKKSLP